MQIHESLQIFAIVQIRSTGMTNFLRDRIISLDHVNVKQNSKFDFVTKEQQGKFKSWPPRANTA